MAVDVTAAHERIAVENEPDSTRVSQLAEKLDCFTEEDFALLNDAKVQTLKSWRSRGEGPPFVKIGNRVLYPVRSAAVWIHGRAKAPARHVSTILEL